MGLLALACGDGVARILSVPHPQQLAKCYDSEGENPSFLLWVEPAVVQALLCSGPIQSEGLSLESGPCFSIEWCRTEGCSKIMAGYSSGERHSCLLCWCVYTTVCAPVYETHPCTRHTHVQDTPVYKTPPVQNTPLYKHTPVQNTPMYKHTHVHVYRCTYPQSPMFITGLVNIWHLTTSSPLLKLSRTREDAVQCLHPLLQISAHGSVCSALCWYASDPKLIITGGGGIMLSWIRVCFMYLCTCPI